ncbi:hypothetical protein FSC37_16460 [Piscinibacter aquaticus]|uniref:SGNH/GDSL hydrolase family protein n=1 Tax=Piscinibacter aquaticus TaxID=392597 RepID=A0A5C6U2L3_9BURK|nr:hypothetical protein FSC37_16460 [Piscinibacter aquaticus]
MIPFVPALRRTAVALAFSAAALLSACGGGDPVVRFEPTRVLAFGDENSLITADARKYTVNALAADANGVKTLNCAANPLWIQQLASSYGLVFPQCNPNAVPNPPSRMYATNGAKVADLVTQVDQHLSSDSFSAKDTVTLFVGQHDVLDLYAQYPTTPAQTLLDAAKAAGEILAGQARASPTLAARCSSRRRPRWPSRPSLLPKTQPSATRLVVICSTHWWRSSMKGCVSAWPRRTVRGSPSCSPTN